MSESIEETTDEFHATASYDERFFKAVLNLCLELSFTAG